VPEDIPIKPNTLSPDEVQVTHNHSLAGYYVLSGMRFAWPVAEMVLQHHERLDGSGYPNGLVGEAIMPEARIIAVADVVEATTALRPQRQPLGLPAALSLVAQQEGVLYDAAAVGACMRLFNQQGFRF
jgi:HD-GYP domain-containing protein (c-di-GMP phosphodiesterase class II)